MNYEEAKTCIEHLEWLKAEIEWDKSIGYQTDIDVAIEALEKQIEKQALRVKKSDYVTEYLCPVCGQNVGYKDQTSISGCHYCDCGQAIEIDWSGNND